MFDLSLFATCILIQTVYLFFFFNDTATTEIYTLSLHDALPIYGDRRAAHRADRAARLGPLAQAVALDVPQRLAGRVDRSEEHTSELQSQSNLVCRLLLEKKKNLIRSHVISSRNAAARCSKH